MSGERPSRRVLPRELQCRRECEVSTTTPRSTLTTWPLRTHLIAIAGVLLASLLSAELLKHYTQAALPLLDSFTTWGSILTTWMVTRKILENWLYWLVIDSVSIYLYLDRGLYLTALLFMAYIVIVIIGYRKWLRHYRQTSS